MSRPITRLAAVVCTLYATSACSKSRAKVAPTATAAPSASASAGADVALDCKVFSPDDVAGLLKAPATLNAHRMGLSDCDFSNNESADVSVSVGGDGSSAQVEWDDATGGPDRAKFVALPGVGDQAMYKAGTSTTNPEVVSKKGTFYCLVTIDGGSDNTYKSLSAGDLAKRLGPLCNKAFAALRA